MMSVTETVVFIRDSLPQQEQSYPSILSPAAFKRISHDARSTGTPGQIPSSLPLLHPHRDLVKAIRGAVLREQFAILEQLQMKLARTA